MSQSSLRVRINQIALLMRMSSLFDREETERVGELQTSSDNTALPDDVLASGSEGVKETIHGFSDAYVSGELARNTPVWLTPLRHTVEKRILQTSVCRRSLSTPMKMHRHHL